MKWKKLGKIFDTELLPDWASTHAQVPTPLIRNQKMRIFFATRNKEGKAVPIYADYNIENPATILNLKSKAILDLGKPGTFDDSGIMPSCILCNDDEIWMYYTGWNQKVLTTYHNSIGLAISKDGGDSFTRLYQGPIMDRTRNEPYLSITPFVIKENNLWKMWYASGTGWDYIENKYEPIYVIKYAESKNGIDWNRFPDSCIPQIYKNEISCNPSVIKIEGIYHMWFCYRRSYDYRNGDGSYRIGHAYSNDGINWIRDDENYNISPSDEGWDSKMMSYPYVFKAKNNYYMLYNGNEFGKTGFGISILKLK